VNFIKTILLCICLLCKITYGFTQEIYTLNYKNDSVDIKVGEKKVVFYNLIGTNETQKYISVKVNLPEGFKLLTNSSEINLLQVGDLRKLFFTIQSESNTAYGSYAISIEVRKDSLSLFTYPMVLTILKNPKLEIVAIEKPDKLSQKPQEEAKFLLKNIGNTEENIELSTRSGKIIGNTNIFLKPGESAVIRTTQSILFSNQDVRQVSFDLIAKIKDVEKPFSNMFSIPMMSFSSAKSDTYQRFPIEASILYNYYKSQNLSTGSFQFDIKGKGYIDSKDKNLVEFIARGPNNTSNTPRFGTITQYYLGYQTGGFKLDLGDNAYSFSQITENGRFATGIQLKQRIKQNQVTLFYIEPKLIRTIKKEYGLSFTRFVNPSSFVSLVYLNKNHIDNRKQLHTDFLTLLSDFKYKQFNAKAELSLSKTKNTFGGGGFFNSSFDNRKVRLYSNLLYTSKTYYGYYNNSLQVNNAAFYKLNRKTSIGFTKTISQLNPSLDSVFFKVSAYVNNNNFSVDHILNKNNKVRFNFIDGSREDKMEVKSYNYNERFLRTTFEHKYKKFNFRLDGDFGKSQNLLLPKENQKYSDSHRYRSQISYTSKRNFGASVFSEYLETNRYQTSAKNSKYWFYGVTTQFKIRNNVAFNLNYRNNFRPEELYDNQSFVDAAMVVSIKNHDLSFAGNYGYVPTPKPEKTFFATVKYTINLNTPIRKKKGLGHISGKLHGVKTEGVILNLNGKQIMTDKQGNFRFNDLQPGKYFIGASNSTLGYGNIIDQNMPFLIEVTANEVNQVQLDVIPTGKVNGVINTVNKDKVKHENILIEIYKDKFSQLVATDKFGQFQFSELKEGDYQIRILSDNIKKQFIVRNPELKVHVTVGQETMFTFNVEEKKKNVIFQKERIILSDL
jgi:hypothetical protein